MKKKTPNKQPEHATPQPPEYTHLVLVELLELGVLDLLLLLLGGRLGLLVNFLDLRLILVLL